MAIDFPAAPTVGQTYTYNALVWTWTGQYWDVEFSGGSGGGCTADSIPPPSPDVGDLWYDTTNGRMYIWYDGVWSEVTGAPAAVNAADLLGTTMAPNVINYPTLTVQRPVGSVSVGGGILFQGGPAYTKPMAISRYQDKFNLQIENDIPLSIGADDVTITATDDVLITATDRALLAGATTDITATGLITIQSAGVPSIQVGSNNIGLNPGVAAGGSLFMNARVVRVLAGSAGPVTSTWGGGMPSGAAGNLFKFADIPVKAGDTLIVRGFADLIPSVAGWAFANFMCVNSGGGDMRRAIENFDSNLVNRKTIGLNPLHANFTYDTTVQVWLQGYTLNGTAAAQSAIWSYEIYATR